MYKKKFSHFIFIMTFSISLMIAMPLIIFNVNYNFENSISKLHEKGFINLDNQIQQIRDNLSIIINYSKSLSKVVSNVDIYDKKSVAKQFENLFVKELGIFQLRLLNSEGMELIRYDLNRDEKIVKSSSLQDKSTRYYYKDAMGLALNELYISKLDLNVENSKIEKPYKKTIRIVQKVKIADKIFYIVANYNLTKVLETSLNTTLYDLFFIDKDGQINMHLDDTYAFSKQRSTNLYKKDFLDKEHQYITQKALNVLPYDVVISIKKTKLEVLESDRLNMMKTMTIMALLMAFVISSLLYHFLEKHLKQLSRDVSNIMEEGSYKNENQFIEFKGILSDVSLQRQMIEDNTQELKKQKEFTNSILNSQSNFILITDGKELKEANKTMLDFLNFSSLEAFHNQHDCICDFFVEEEGYLPKKQNGKSWIDVVLKDIHKHHKVMMKDLEGNRHIFHLFTEKLGNEKGSFVMSLSDITELTTLQNSLEVKVNEQLNALRTKDQQLIHQSRLAQMGEMISMIAHQWRQPLGAISSTSIDMNLKLQFSEFDLEKKDGRDKCKTYFLNSLEEIDGFVQNLTTTIDDFRNFYKPGKKTITAIINLPVTKALNIVKATFESEGIEIIEEYKSKKSLNMHENELMQVILNVLKNAQDNFMEKSTQNAKIWIKTYDVSDSVRLEISDNGGGIPEDILQKIFDPYFSTKSEKDGTGLGLYMSKTIVQTHHEGKLYAKNLDEGVCFFIDMKSEKDKIVENITEKDKIIA